MLVRDDGDAVLCIGQASHAWMSGQMARAWAEPFEPREEVCLAAEQHDVGMAEWDLHPQLHPEAGCPVSFTEMALEDHLRLWAGAPAKLLSQSRYAALLVSLHGTALYERRDIAGMPAAEADAVRAYLAGERALQERLITLLGADRAQVARNQRLVFAWDGLSLALCLGWDHHVAADVPAAGDAGVDVRLEPAAGGPSGRFLVDPWPFADAEVKVRCEGCRLAGGYATASDLRAALEEAAAVSLDFTLTPSG